jgi:transcriptional regulator with XRE-family HTH domain
MPKLKKFRPTCIRQWRHYRGMTLETVAERIDMTPGLVSLVERGLRGYTQDTVEALASAMRTDPAALLTRDPTDPNAIWGLWDKAKPAQRKQITEAAIKIVKGRSNIVKGGVAKRPIAKRPVVKGRSNARKRGHR